MPVDKDEWDAGRKGETLEARILTYLRNNRDKGFTYREIFSGLGYRGARPQDDFWGFVYGVALISTIQHALETLVKQGSVKAKIVKEKIGEGTYYMAT